MNPLLVIVGLVLLLPGLCGTFFFAIGFINPGSSAESQAYATLFSAVAVPSIQVGCLGLWIMARESSNALLRNTTRIAGAFGAIAAVVLLINFIIMANKEARDTHDWLTMVGIGAGLAIIPFLLGGLPALRLNSLPDPRP